MIRFIKRYLRNLGLSYKLILYLFPSIAIVFLVAFLYSYNIAKTIVEKNLKMNAETVTTASAEQIDNALTAIRKIPDNFAKIIESYDYSPDELVKLLRQVVENNSEIYGTALAFKPYGFQDAEEYFAVYLYRKGAEIKLKPLDSDQYNYVLNDWYITPREANHPIWSEPYQEKNSDMMMITYSLPLYRYVNGEKRFVGVLMVDIMLDWLQPYFSSIKINKTGYGFMISAKGTLVAHPDQKRVLTETIFSIADAQKSEQLRMIGNNMVAGQKSFAEIEYRNLMTGKQSWIAYAPVAVTGWSIGMVFPVDEFMSDVNRLFNNLIYLGCGGLIIFLAVIAWISRSIISPLRELTQAAAQLAAGNFEKQLPSHRGLDEIGRLKESFIAMQKALASTIRDLQDASAKLKISNDKLEEYSRTLEQRVEERTEELRLKNEELDAAFNNVSTLNEIGEKITSTLNLDEIHDMVYRQVNSLMDAASLLIMIYNEPERKLECKLSIEKGSRLPSFTISMDEKDRFAVWCVEHASPIFMNDVDNEWQNYVSHRAKPLVGETVSSLIYIPLMIENHVLGVLSAQSFKKNAYTVYQFNMLSSLANFIAIALENALAYAKINKANADLKAAQAQLVVSEKMASLGQLTAGIAHEIKNPLNFVNNFAELTVELTDELSAQVTKWSGYLQEKDRQYLLEIAGDIRSNAQKINDHGKRADSIVKGMLLHSRGKAGDRQPTDVNALLAEYVNLGFHGMRAMDGSFNIKIDADYDPAIGQIMVVPQDISRVFLNIINNGCYSTSQKKQQQRDVYFPVLTVKTKLIGNQVEIRIHDNGLGIPADVLDKIFDPFFTTKPPGQGTGLGLSLSYEIVVQQHGGELKVESRVGEYAEFIIRLPHATT